MEVLLTELARSGIVAVVLAIMFVLHYRIIEKHLPALLKENKDQIAEQSRRHQGALERLMVTHREAMTRDREEFKGMLDSVTRHYRESLDGIETRRAEAFRTMERMMEMHYQRMDEQHTDFKKILEEISRRIKKIDSRQAIMIRDMERFYGYKSTAHDHSEDSSE